MFSYYGSKSKIVHLYPKPRHDKIIEPFAGSARYSLRYFDHDILLVDKYKVIVDVWHYLQQASEKDIMGLPEPKFGESLDNFSLSDGEKLLMGFWAWRGAATPQKIIQGDNDIHGNKKFTAKNLYKIRSWRIVLGSWDKIENQEATWFIDPPYQAKGGHKYKENNENIDFLELARWSKERRGQVIVCESMEADWLPFYPMRNITGTYSKTTEAIWCNHPHDYQSTQPALFSESR